MEHSHSLSGLEHEAAQLFHRIKDTFMVNGREYKMKGPVLSTKLQNKGTVDISHRGIRICNARVTDKGLLSLGYAELSALAEAGSHAAKEVLQDVHDAVDGIRAKVTNMQQSLAYAMEAGTAA